MPKLTYQLHRDITAHVVIARNVLLPLFNRCAEFLIESWTFGQLILGLYTFYVETDICSTFSRHYASWAGIQCQLPFESMVSTHSVSLLKAWMNSIIKLRFVLWRLRFYVFCHLHRRVVAS
jgi:hypothetical protein